MRTLRNTLAIAACALFVSGCIYVHSERTIDEPPVHYASPPGPAPSSQPVLWADPEIRAASQLNLESSRVQAFMRIASKPSLAPQSQDLLVRKAYGSLNLESSKVMVLNALISNPHFSNAGKAAVLNGIGNLNLESSKVHVLAMVEQRGALPW